MSKEITAYFSVGKHSAIVRGHGREFSGACLFGCGASDSFKLWPNENHIEGVGTLGGYCCLGPKQGRNGCGRGGDGIRLLREVQGMTFADACAALDVDPDALKAHWQREKGLPVQERSATKKIRAAAASDVALADRAGTDGQTWREYANGLVRLLVKHLRGNDGREALRELHARGFSDTTITSAELGYSPKYVRMDARLWGYNDRMVRIPRGLVIPWRDTAGNVVCLRFRRLTSDESTDARDFYGVNDKTGKINRYRVVSGSSTQHLYREATITPACDVALFEGEFDALIASQQTGDLAAVATGSTAWGRSERATTVLNGCTTVLVCYDANNAGYHASEYWLDAVRCAKPWYPLWGDANEMHLDGVDLRQWLRIGLGYLDIEPTVQEDIIPCSLCSVEVAEYTDTGVPYCALHFEALSRTPMTQKAYTGMVARVAAVFPGVCTEHHDAEGYTLQKRVQDIEIARRQRDTSMRERYASARKKKVVMAG